MSYSVENYKNLLKSLLPRGRTWSRENGDMPNLLDGVAREFPRLDALVSSLIAERDSRYTSVLLSEHEEDLDIIPGVGATDAERRSIIRSILTAMGGLNPQYYIDLAAAMGYTITIDEFRPGWCGILVCGEPIGDQHVIFVWRVNLLYSSVDPDPTGEELRAVLEIYKPAHTSLLFTLVGPGYSRGFSSGFDAIPALTPAQLAVGGFRWRGFTKGFDLKYGGGFRYGAFARGYNNLK